MTEVKRPGEELLPSVYDLWHNYPNPFNPTTTIVYALPRSSRVTLEVYNLLGQCVRTLVDETEPPGVHRVLWDGRDANGQQVSSGCYFYRLVAQSTPAGAPSQRFVKTLKMLLLQ
ncbi:MAG: T9SS type A sorting domain-containing protein [Calditrichaeota bacterium]|nr:T9SS type A sorting domain-containing protein [Calditrichota bacterium]